MHFAYDLPPGPALFFEEQAYAVVEGADAEQIDDFRIAWHGHAGQAAPCLRFGVVAAFTSTSSSPAALRASALAFSIG